MYNHGNYSTQFGQNFDRPQRPQFPLQPSGHPPQPPLQQRPPLPPPPPLIQQATPPNSSSSYPLSSSVPPHMNLSVSFSSMPSSGQPYLNPLLPVHGTTSMIHPYLMNQQNLQYPSQMGSQNANYAPPSQPSIGDSKFPHPPPPSQSQAMYRPLSHQPGPSTQQNVLHMPPPRPSPSTTPVSSSLLTSTPPLPPPPSVSSLPSCPRSSSSPSLETLPSEVLNLPPPPPPPRPNDAKIVRNIEILCQFISKNGPAFEDMARQKEAGNPEFNFLFGGGEPGSEAAVAQEYYLWMKKKSCLDYDLLKGQSAIKSEPVQVELQSSRQPNNSEGALCSLSDSDMEMEDDITCPDNEQMVGSNLFNGLNEELVPVGDEVEIHEQESSLRSSGDVMQTLNSIHLANSVDDDVKNPDKASVHIIESDMPLRLIEEYASDDASEQDNEAHVSGAMTISGFPQKKFGAMTSDGDLIFHDPESRATGLGLPKADQVVPERSALGGDNEATDNDAGSKTSDLSSSKALQEREAFVSSGADGASGSCKAEKETVKSSAPMKVDELGRLIRDGVSDSDSDDTDFTRRHGRRGRSHSHSRSPLDRKRRRSPLMNKDRRSRSRSWSPRRRRSRSRSPLRRSSDFGGENFGQRKSHMPQCFDFLKGRCYRGASCRYMHNESDKYDRSRHHRSRQHLSEAGASSRISDFHEQNKDMVVRVSSNDDEVRGEEMKLHQRRHSSSCFASKGAVDDEKDRAEPLNSSACLSLLGQDGDASVADENKNATPKGLNSLLRKSDSHVVLDLPSSRLVDAEKHSEDQKVNTFETEVSAQLHKGFDNHYQPQQTNASVSESAFPPSSVLLHQGPQVAAQLSKKSDESLCEKDVMASDSFIANFPNHVSQHSQPPPLLLHGASVTSYCTSLPNQQPYCRAPQNLSWSNLPQSFPVPSCANPPIPGAPAHFQPSDAPVRRDLVNQTSLNNPSELPSLSQIGVSQTQTYPDPGQPLMHIEDFRNTVLHPNNSLRKPAELPNLPTGLLPSRSYAQGNMQPRPGTLQYLPSLHHQPSSYGPYQTAGDTIPSQAGGSSSMSRYFSEFLPRNHTSYYPDVGSRLTPHFNPYASTFDQPLSSKFSSTVCRQEGQEGVPYGSKYDTPFEGQKAGNQGVSLMVVSPLSSMPGEQILARSGGDQYDPLFDSIEPSSASFKKNAHWQDDVADNSDVMLRLSDSRKPLDVEENNKSKKKEVGSAATSVENDGFGETAEAEIGAMESQSPSNPEGDEAPGETEIDQVKKEGKSKKSKDSRSMKLFKAELASFVKEILKPSWRQGNMSKEAFKTIVKKTVDKVSGAMKGRRLPKSKAKIKQYIDSSHWKLTQLVEGYVNKYAKA